jgi:competence protein ComEC
VVLGIAMPWWLALALVVVLAAWVVVGARPMGAMVLVVLMLAGVASGAAASARQRVEIVAPPSGPVTVTAAVVADPIGEWGDVAVVRPVAIGERPWSGPRLAARPMPEVEVGDVVEVVATLEPGVRRIRSQTVAGTLSVRETTSVRGSVNPLFVVGNGLRARVRATFDSGSAGGALVNGLLIGDTSEIPAPVLEDLRQAGLAHFVAVSGSNVALFLGAWWILGAPIAVRPRLRVAYGLAGLAVFAVATRFEPSVIRASVMAAVPLVGGLLSIPADPWMALGIAVTIVLLVSAELITSVGFLLSVFATAGVLLGVAAVRGRRPRWWWVPLGATIGAQAAVAPILLAVFGTIPLAAPLTNVLAGPVVAVTTGIGLGAVVVPLPILASVTELGADLLTWIAGLGAGGPQLGLAGVLVLAATGSLMMSRSLRPLGFAVAAVAIISVGLGGPAWPTTPTVVVLDVGQGDAILLQDPSGRTVLVDGGRDPSVLSTALRRHGVRSVDLVVVTHGDADHVGGLIDLVSTGGVDAIWVSTFAPVEGLLEDLTTAASKAGTPVVEVEAGAGLVFGSFDIEVLAPARRFASDNDGSLVLMVSGGRSILLPGDIEAIGQRELPEIHPDVLVVPHHGSATTDLRWLGDLVPELAIVSYGENRFGHPHPDVLAMLDRSGATVRHTHIEGDIVIPLGPP